MLLKTVLVCIIDGDGDEPNIGTKPACLLCSVEINPPMLLRSLLLGSDIEVSLAFGEVEVVVVVDDMFLSLFFIVEFQKFFISLSVRPGKRAAI